MSTEETITYNVQYNVRGVDDSIRKTQRYLYFVNAVRLSIVDLQEVMRGPTLSNILWTTIQLTRAWTHLNRIVKATNVEQARGVGGMALRSALGGATTTTTSAMGGVAGTWTVSGAFGVGTGAGGGSVATATKGFVTALALKLGVSTAVLGVMAGGVTFGAGLMYLKHRRVKQYKDWRERQREIARSQGLEF